MSKLPGQAKQLFQRFDLAAKYSVNVEKELVYTTWDDLVHLNSLVDFAGAPRIQADKARRMSATARLLQRPKTRLNLTYFSVTEPLFAQSYPTAVLSPLPSRTRPRGLKVALPASLG